jgi:hypothetical protein
VDAWFVRLEKQPSARGSKMNATTMRMLAAVLLTAPVAAQATSFYVQSVDDSTSCGSRSATSSSPVSISGTCTLIGGALGLNFGTISSAARATGGAVGAQSTATSTGEFLRLDGGATAQAASAPITFSFVGPGPAPGDAFLTSANFELKGVMGITGELPNISTVEVIFDVGTLARYSYLMGGNGTQVEGSSFASTGGTIGGDIRKLEFDLDLTTPAFWASLSSPFDLPFSLTVRTGASQSIVSTAFASFFDSATFAVGRPVFNLPDGYTANAGDYLVNNRYGEVVRPVAEPGALALLCLGLAGLGLSRRRKAS